MCDAYLFGSSDVVFEVEGDAGDLEPQEGQGETLPERNHVLHTRRVQSES